MVGALNLALGHEMQHNDRVVMFGVDVGTLGGVFRVTDGLTERFGEERCFDTPISEAGIMGAAIGMAMYGLRPVIEMQFDAFGYPAFEQMVSNLAKMRNRTRGDLSMPVVVRMPYGGGVVPWSITATVRRGTPRILPDCTCTPLPTLRMPTICCARQFAVTTR